MANKRNYKKNTYKSSNKKKTNNTPKTTTTNTTKTNKPKTNSQPKTNNNKPTTNNKPKTNKTINKNIRNKKKQVKKPIVKEELYKDGSFEILEITNKKKVEPKKKTDIKAISSNVFNNILKYIKIVLIGLKNIIVTIFVYIGKFFSLIWHKLKEIDRKDAEKKAKKREKKDIKYETSTFKLQELEELDRDELVLLSYKGRKNKIGVFLENRGRVLKFDMKKFGKRFKYGTFKDKALIILMIFLIFIFACSIALIIYVIATAPDIDPDRLYKASSTVVYDKNGNEFARLGTENREKVTYDDLPQVLIDAIVATEDSRFFQHNGVDVARFTKAAFGQLLGRDDAGGGSTITMQLSKHTATSNEAHGLEGIVRKFQDIYLAVFVYEKKFTKEQLLEFYVNIEYLGAAYGVQQASRAYYGKDVSDLNLSEAAMIAGLFQAPYAYNPYSHPVAAEKRRNTVLNLMERHGYISEEEKQAAQDIPIKSLLAGYNSELNEHIRFIDTVVEEVLRKTGKDPYTESMNIWTTMDPEKQKVVNDIQNGVTYKYANEYSENGIAVVDVDTGALTAVGSGRSKKSARSFNYATDGRRHPGSTAKPVVDYGPAIEYLGWGSGNTVIDKQYEYSSGGKFKNWDGKYDGVTTAKSALARSRNIPALLTFKQTTNDQKLKMAEDLGWKLETSSGTILETCSIGGFTGVTPVESAGAYAAFARGGTYIEPYSFTKVVFTDTNEEYINNPKKVQAMSEETAYIITDILHYAVTSGAVGIGGGISGSEVASKTGTSTVDSAVLKKLGINKSIDGDVWQVAYNQKTVISLWYSYPTLTKEHYLTPSEGSKARRGIIKLLSQGLLERNTKFNRPSGVTTATIELGTDPIQLASEFTPDGLKSVEVYNKNSVPTETSNRFSRLDNPSNLKISSSGASTTLSWSDAPYPDAISESYLREYFTNSPIYSYWAEESLRERLDWNRANIGDFGYQIYMNNSSGSHDLGFVTSNNFTYNGIISPGTTFTVKSSYSIFKANQSTGISANAQSNVTPTLTLSLPSCIKISDLKSYAVNNNLKSLEGLSLKNNSGTELKNSANITLSCSKYNMAANTCTDKINEEVNSNGSAQITISASSSGYNSTSKNTTVKTTC